MVDDLRSDDGLGGFAGPHHRPLRRSDKGHKVLADREVPLGHQENEQRVLAPAVHQWLDGELPEASVRKGMTARDVEFWKNLSGEIERRRRVHTPTHLEARIMEAVPQTVPALITPWYQREFVITPAAAVGAAAALVILSSVATAAIMFASR